MKEQDLENRILALFQGAAAMEAELHPDWELLWDSWREESPQLETALSNAQVILSGLQQTTLPVQGSGAVGEAEARIFLERLTEIATKAPNLIGKQLEVVLAPADRAGRAAKRPRVRVWEPRIRAS